MDEKDLALAFCFGILLSTIFWGMAVNLVSSDGEIELGGERFVRVVAEPVEVLQESEWCEAWEFFDCVPEGCNDGGVYYQESFVSLKFLIVEDVNGWSDTSVESTNCECHSKSRFWRRC